MVQLIECSPKGSVKRKQNERSWSDCNANLRLFTLEHAGVHRKTKWSEEAIKTYEFFLSDEKEISIGM